MADANRDQLLHLLEQEGVIDPTVQAAPDWEEIWEAMDVEHLQALLEVKRRFDEIANTQNFAGVSWWGIIK
jgi:predicted transcriptional regulator